MKNDEFEDLGIPNHATVNNMKNIESDEDIYKTD
jgi:hypothetical protein